MAFEGRVWPWAALVLLLLAAMATTAEAAGHRALLQGNSGDRDQGPPPGAVVAPDDPFDEKFEMAEDELLVNFKPGATPEQKGKALGKGRAAEKRVVRSDAEDGDVSLVTVELSPGQSGRAQLRAAAAQIQADEDVEYAEPNFIYRPVQVSQPNDQYFTNLWGMKNGAGGANAVGAWAAGYTDCSDVVIGVIDEGIQFSHPDLKAHMWVNPRETAIGDGTDNDGNGYKDDIYGWDFVSNDATVYDGTVDDHGTHVAGTIAAVGNNGAGVVGVCQSGIKLISAKFLGPNGGTTSGAVAALDYLLNLKKIHNLNLVATSNSWGGGGYSQALFDAIQRHNNANILFIAAAGNNNVNTDTTANYPSCYNVANVISVGSITSLGDRSSFSNYGVNTVDLFAPGSSIVSTIPDSSYASYSGTSMATPHVTGAVALYAAAYKRATGFELTAAPIKQAVMDSGTQDTRYTGFCVSGKRLNIGGLLDTPRASPMTVQVAIVSEQTPSLTYYVCKATISVINATSGLPLAGATVVGTFTINPDVNGCTDYLRTFPSTTTIVSTTAPYVVNSPTLRSQIKCSRQNYRTTTCSFTVTSVTHPQAVLVRTDSVFSATSAQF